MKRPAPQDGFGSPYDVECLRRVIPHFARAGLLRRVDLIDGGIEFVDSQTDLVFASFDGMGRSLIAPTNATIDHINFPSAA